MESGLVAACGEPIQGSDAPDRRSERPIGGLGWGASAGSVWQSQLEPGTVALILEREGPSLRWPTAAPPPSPAVEFWTSRGENTGLMRRRGFRVRVRVARFTINPFSAPTTRHALAPSRASPSATRARVASHGVSGTGHGRPHWARTRSATPGEIDGSRVVHEESGRASRRPVQPIEWRPREWRRHSRGRHPIGWTGRRDARRAPHGQRGRRRSLRRRAPRSRPVRPAVPGPDTPCEATRARRRGR